MEIGGFNKTIVSNGVVLNNEYWDEDLGNDVFTIPKDEMQTRFYYYMTVQPGSFEDLAGLHPNTIVNRIQVDSDKNVLNPTIRTV